MWAISRGPRTPRGWRGFGVRSGRSLHDGVRTREPKCSAEAAATPEKAPTASLFWGRGATPGTRLKILEAAACGVPVVSTSIGAEGLELSDGEHIRIADSAAGFAAAVSDLLADPGTRRRQAAAARRRVEEKYGWDSIGRAFSGELLRRRPKGSA